MAWARRTAPEKLGQELEVLPRLPPERHPSSPLRSAQTRSPPLPRRWPPAPHLSLQAHSAAAEGRQAASSPSSCSASDSPQPPLPVPGPVPVPVPVPIPGPAPVPVLDPAPAPAVVVVAAAAAAVPLVQPPNMPYDERPLLREPRADCPDPRPVDSWGTGRERRREALASRSRAVPLPHCRWAARSG
eukprot:scaffold1254_cov251-Pinguiococcus_pyrenoidosus.AAC.3